MMREIAVLISLAVALAGCSVPTGTRSESELLPRPGARVEMGAVENESGEHFDVDAQALLRAAMQEALRTEGLAWVVADGDERFALNLAIVEYRPGNAFKRWLLPGYGSTVLSVRGTLTDARTGGLAATVVHDRSVHWGGAYTIGAWQTIFGSVARDIAADLRTRIERGGEFVVAVQPRAEQAAVPAPAADATRVRIAAVEDRRTERGRIGERSAAFGVSMGDIHLARRVPELIGEALADDLLAGGCLVVQSGEDVTVEATVRKFWVHTDTTPVYWDVIGEVEVDLSISFRDRPPVRRQYACRQSKRTYVWPSAGLVGSVLDACLAELGSRVRADPVWGTP